MRYRTFVPGDSEVVRALFNDVCPEIGYKPYETAEAFVRHIVEDENFSPDGCFLACREGGEVAGFVNAVAQKEFLPGQTKINTPGYIQFLIVGEKDRGSGIGSRLLELAEEYLRTGGKTEVRFSHKCPIKMSWYVNECGHEHNKAPGIKLDSLGYRFFLNRGYDLVQKEVSYFLLLKEYQMPEDVREKERELEASGIRITFFEEGRNYGYEEMFERLHDESFLKKFRDGLREQKKLLIAEDGDKRVCATAGCVYPEENGRGFFSALAADPAYGGKGIGQVLFFRLCEVLRDMGAEYMTLFVTSDNFARKIYEKAGFEAVQEWGIIRKAL